MFRENMEEDLEFIEKLYEAVSTLRELGLQKKAERKFRIAQRKLVQEFSEKFPIYSYAEGGYKCHWEYDSKSSTYIPTSKDGYAWQEVEGIDGRVKVKVCIFDANEFERDYTGKNRPPDWTLKAEV
jgi:hypothetical protein